MASDLKAAVINDLQIPRHDPLAVEVATQIIADFKPDILDLNGDQTDFISLSAYPSIKVAPDETICELSEEIERTNTILRDIVKRTKVKRVKWKNGNHEWRLLRALSQVSDTRVKKILELTGVKKAWSYESLFEFGKMGAKVEFAGEYPNGSWLHPQLPPDQNVWVEHGYTASKNSGYTVINKMRERGCSVIVGHCEKLAGPLWEHKVGNRSWFGIENWNLSLIGIPAEGGKMNGEGMYMGVPHSQPDYMNHQQGFSLLVYTNGLWHPQTIRIAKGQAYYNGKLYKA